MKPANPESKAGNPAAGSSSRRQQLAAGRHKAGSMAAAAAASMLFQSAEKYMFVHTGESRQSKVL